MYVYVQYKILCIKHVPNAFMQMKVSRKTNNCMAHCTSGNTVHVKASLDVQKVLFKLKKCSNYFCVSLRDPFIRNVSQRLIMFLIVGMSIPAC